VIEISIIHSLTETEKLKVALGRVIKIQSGKLGINLGKARLEFRKSDDTNSSGLIKIDIEIKISYTERRPRGGYANRFGGHLQSEFRGVRVTCRVIRREDGKILEYWYNFL